VTVADGIYTGLENTKLYLAEKDLRLQSANGPNNCVIDGGGINHFIDIRGASSATVVSGLTIVNGLSDGASGIGLIGGRPMITSCVFRNNEAPNGAAVYCVATEYATFTDCLFHNNRAREWTSSTGSGGAAVFYPRQLLTGGFAPAQALMDNCVFVGNRADQLGGAIYNGGLGLLELVDCMFVDNLAHRAGAVYNSYSPSRMANCRFVGNRAEWISGWLAFPGFGGAIASTTASSVIDLYNCLLAGNTALRGGAVDAAASSILTIVNSTLAHNAGEFEAGGVLIEIRDGAAQCDVHNAIAWGNTPGQIVTRPGGTTTVSYSCIEGGHAGSANIPADPQFVDGPWGSWTAEGVYDATTGLTTLVDTTAGWLEGELIGMTVNPDTSQYRQSLIVDNTASTMTVWGDFASLGGNGVAYQVHDYHLSVSSPATDAGDNSALPADTLDLDGDGDTAEPLPVDFDKHARVLCNSVDMGPYEFGIGDYDCNRLVNLVDFAHWADCMTGPGLGPYGPGCEAFDFVFDGDVDLGDFGGFQQVLNGS
jgi:hypothetical protein